jgi:transcriptional regulator with XRE-family HTH domain
VDPNMDYLEERLVALASTVPVTQIAKETGINRAVLEEIKNGNRRPSMQVIDRFGAYCGLGMRLVPLSESELAPLRTSVLRKPRRRRTRKSDSLRDRSGPGKLSSAQEGHAVPRSQNENGK